MPAPDSFLRAATTQTVSPFGAMQQRPPNGPLCPQLYQALRTRVGPVKITAEGEGFATNGHRRADGSLQLVIVSAGEYYRVNCLFCNDTRQRLWVNHMFGGVDSDGNRLTYLAHCYNEDCLSKPGKRREFVDLVLGFRNVAERRNFQGLPAHPGRREPATLTTAEPPGTVFLLNDLPAEHEAVRYMLNARRYTRDMLERYRIGFCAEANPRYPLALNRIIFPIYFDNQYVGWQSRFIGDVNWNALGIPKYFTMPGFHKRLCLYNYDVAKHKDFIVVTEGVTDVHVGGAHFVALFGKTLSQRQQLLLLNIGENKPIIFMLDGDAYEEMEGIIHSIIDAPGRHPVITVRLPNDFDPADYDRTTLWNIVTAEASRRGLQIQFTG